MNETAPRKKVLIITYYWPPSGGSGVQRWLKFVKYLPEFGWQPYVFTPENPSFALRDESLLKDVPEDAEVIHFPIWEPYEIFATVSSLLGKKQSAKPTDVVPAGKGTSIFQRFSVWLRGNLLVPDPRRFWVSPSVKFLDEFLHANAINTIITTGPPHSLHLIGLRLKKRNPQLRWIADFRDPWSEWGFLDTLKIIPAVRNAHRKLERRVLQTADEVITITPFYVRQFERLSGRKVALFTNGFDEEDFASLQYTKSAHFIIRHVGIVNERCDPRHFLTACAELAKSNQDFADLTRIEFIGEVHERIQSFVKDVPELKSITSFQGNIPHKELIQRYGSSSLLLLVLTGYKDAEGYMPGKLFEYIATGLPVMAVGPVHGDASLMMKETDAGVMVSGDDLEETQRTILNYFEQWKNSSEPLVRRGEGQKFSRRNITKKLGEFLS